MYLLTLTLCVPTDLFSALLPGHRQLLVPVATALCCLAWLIFMRGRFTAVRGNMSLVWALLVIFLGLAVLSAVTNVNVVDSLLLVATYAVRFVMLFVLVQILTEDDFLLVRVQRLLVIVLAFVAFLMMTGILDSLGGYLRPTEAGGLTILRASAGLGDPNFTALAFNIGVAFGLAWSVSAATRTMRYVAIAAVLVLVLGIGKTVSIGGLVGLAVVLFLSWWRMMRVAGRRRSSLVLLTIGILVAMVVVGGGMYLARIQQQAARAQHSIGSLGTQRLNLSLGGLKMAVQHPFSGVGLANTSRSMPGYLPFYSSQPNQESHDGFIDIMDETGIPSFLLMVGIWVLVFRLVCRANAHLRRYNLRFWFMVGEGFWIAMVATLIQTFALGTQREPLLWFILALMLAFSLRILGTTPITSAPTATAY